MSESNVPVSLGSIFICYRREDSADATGRIYDRLADHFGSERVFIDVEAIRLGYDFRSEIDHTIKACSMVIVVIGDQWLSEVEGKRRIDDENDRVRLEIEAAFRRDIPIIPVLVRGASHPTKAVLPASLEPLAYRHGTSIRHEHFRGDVDFLISQMTKLVGRHDSPPSKPPKPKEPQETETTSGDAAAQNALGLRYQNGEDVLQDWGKAAELYQKAADQGYAPAQSNLGELYQWGSGVPQDPNKAAELYQKAADQGYAPAQFKLGALYEKGEGVPKDLRKAAELYQKAAGYDPQYDDLQFATLSEFGESVPLDAPVQPDDKLAAIVGSQPLSRPELTKKLWNYIRRRGLQDKKKEVMINADDQLKPVFNGKSQVNMFEMTELVSKHLR